MIDHGRPEVKTEPLQYSMIVATTVERTAIAKEAPDVGNRTEITLPYRGTIYGWPSTGQTGQAIQFLLSKHLQNKAVPESPKRHPLTLFKYSCSYLWELREPLVLLDVALRGFNALLRFGPYEREIR